MALTQTATIPGPGPSWDEQVVPALKKRLENESRTLARRISAISSSSAEAGDNHSTAPSNHTATNKPRPQSHSRTDSRSRTYSQPYSRENSASNRPTSPPNQNGKSRIPLPQRTRSRAGSMSSQNTNRVKTPTPNDNDAAPPASDLWILHERPSHSRLVNEPAPFPQPGSSASSVDALPDPRRSTDSEERPFEHWYRGEVSRNGGVGEYRVVKRQEMLDIANYGHSMKSSRKPNAITEAIELQRQRRGRPRADSFGERTSVYLDEDQAGEIARVLDEGPLTDLDAGEQEEEEDDYYDPMEDYYRPGSTGPDNEPSYRATTPTPSNIQQPPSRIPRSSTPTQIQRGQSEPPYFSSSSATGSPSASSSAPATPKTRQQTPQSQKRTTTSPPLSSTPKGKRKASASPSSNSRLAISKATQAKLAQSKRQKEREEESRRSIAVYPDPGDDPMHAIPTWTQPVPQAGNWDDVVLPVVARKRGLDGHYEHADGTVQPKKETAAIAPAPGTFGFDHSKYRPPREDGVEGDNIPMDEFGARQSQRDEQEEMKADSRQPSYPLQQTRHDQIRIPTGAGYQSPPSPEPFASRPSTAANAGPEQQRPPVSTAPMSIDVEMGRDGQNRDEEDQHKRGCCGCVVM